MAMDWTKVLTDMLTAAEGVAKTEWPKLKGEAEDQFKILTQVAMSVEARKATGQMSDTNARFLMAQHKMATQNVLYSIEGQTNILIEQVVNAALDILRTALRTATGGWILL